MCWNEAASEMVHHVQMVGGAQKGEQAAQPEKGKSRTEERKRKR